MIITKECKKCNILKPISQFRQNNRSKDKLQYWCIDCFKYHRQNNKKNNIIIDQKICTTCNILKPTTDFHKDNTNKNGYHYICKKCRSSIIKKKRDQNKELYNKRHREWLKTDKGKKSIHKNKFKNNLRTRILKALQQNQKSKSTFELIGCSIEYLKKHLQITAINHGYIHFNIDDYSTKDYHIDHIIPCSSFNLSILEEQQKCFHWTNLQILTAEENLKKHNNLI